MLCLMFSFLAWLSIKISRETVSTIPLELQISGVPNDLIIASLPDSTFTLSLQTTGIRLLTNRSMKRMGVLEADFNLFQKARGNNDNLYFFTANQAEIRYSLTNDIPRQQLKIQPDTIYIITAPAFRKKIPVVVRKELDFRKGFRVYSFPVVTPDSVWIWGPAAFKDSMQFIQTDIIRATNVDKNIQLNVGLENPFRQHNFAVSTNQVSVFIPIEEFTEASVELDLSVDCPETDSLFPGSRIFLFPDKVTTTYLVALKDLKAISNQMFKATVGCPDTLARETARLQVHIKEHPGIVEIIRSKPSEVEYVLIKNN